MKNINKHVSKERWLVYCSDYTCFAGYEHTEYWFQTAIEAWKFYKRKSYYDYDFEDSYKMTGYPRLMSCADTYVLPEQRKHARSAEDWKEMCEPSWIEYLPW